ncbi:hypothetical protein GOP47_0023284 [Adiantum capillus-veneris]|uniref:FAS1 domain-containing protein n=1 Tax=Adiantum capillus-veneris TaxID=13818 RepID=A0A9D4U7V1_ADICA|nr:hypothetical protein GOP47_0023284 [Adiantum capillus-veneris]
MQLHLAAPSLPLIVLLSLLVVAAPCIPSTLAAFQNVTTLLDNHPDYSLFNGLLSQYGVAAQINSRTTITVLSPHNRAVNAFLAGRGAGLDRQSLFNILSFHVLLDYEDPEKLRTLAGGFATITTLYQTTGLAEGEDGFLNVTVFEGVAKAHSPGNNSFATIGSSLEKFPFNISLLAVDQVLIPSGIGGPASPPVNLSQIISQAGNFSQFVSLLVSTGVDKVLQSHDSPPGITIFAPTNAAFDRMGSSALSRLTSAQLVALMEFHALVSFYPTEELATASGPQSTLTSGSGGGAYTITLSQNKAGIIIINAGGNNVPIAGTLYSNNPVAVFVIDSVLLPKEIFGAAAVPSPLSSEPSPAPVSTMPAPATSPATNVGASPSPISTKVPSPSPLVPGTPPPVSTPLASPPAPPTPAPSTIFSPAEGPSALSPESPTSSSHLIVPCSPFAILPFIAFFLSKLM